MAPPRPPSRDSLLPYDGVVTHAHKSPRARILRLRPDRLLTVEFFANEVSWFSVQLGTAPSTLLVLVTFRVCAVESR
jgi:hypothetical protein